MRNPCARAREPNTHSKPPSIALAARAATAPRGRGRALTASSPGATIYYLRTHARTDLPRRVAAQEKRSESPKRTKDKRERSRSRDRGRDRDRDRKRDKRSRSR